MFPNFNVLYIASSSDEELEVNILHFNDAHARFAPIGKDTNICRTADANAGKCYGGFAHISNIITEYRKTAEKDGSAVLAFNAGDTFTGTPFFSMYGEEVSAAYMNTLGLDAMVSCTKPYLIIIMVDGSPPSDT